jgi:threonyl-tRNA synthetase
MGDNTIAEDSLKKIDSKAMEICKQKHPFQRLVLSKEQALEMFAANPFKVPTLLWILCLSLTISLSLSLSAPLCPSHSLSHLCLSLCLCLSPSLGLPLPLSSQVNLIQNKVPDGSKTTVYKCGPLIDLCMGPHLPNTGKIKVIRFFWTYPHRTP